MFEPRAIDLVADEPAAHLVPQNPQTLMQKLFGIEGRIDRASYIGLSLLQMVAAFVLVIISMMFIELSRGLAMALLATTGVLCMWSVVAVTTKRYHDLDASGWWQLLGVVPIIGWLIPVYLALKPGSEGANRYGPLTL